MKNKMSDVRDHLVLMMEELGEPAATARPDAVERAKAMSMVAGTYISAVKVELDAARVAKELGYIPAAVAGCLATVGPDGKTNGVPMLPAR